jgi:hypothetical protein
MENDDLASSITRRHEELASMRVTFESHWEEIAERVLPRAKGSFTGRFSTTNVMQGEKQTEKMYDSTAAIALERFAAVMDSMLTPQSSKWHRLRADDKNLNRDPMVLRYFDEVTELLFKYRYAPRAGFANQNHERYMSLGAFGTGTVMVDRLEGGGLRYRCIPLAELYLLENHQGVIDTAHRRYTLTGRQAMQKFGKDALPEKMSEQAEKKPDKEFEFIHCVKPREDLKPGRMDYRGMAWASYHVAIEGKKVVREGGYRSWPFPTGRYVQAPGEIYGRSPAMMVLPNIKVLNEQKKTMLKVGHRAVDPVLLAFDDGVVDSFSLRPGAINPGGLNAQGQKMIQPLDMASSNLLPFDKLMEQERIPINDVFLVNLFQILVETPQMTATEVLERAREKGILLGPSMSRQMSEYLGPLIEREMDVLAADGLLPEMPPLLREAQGEYAIVYESPLSRQMRFEELTGFNRLLEQAATYASATNDPRILDHFNFDEAIPDAADIQGVKPRWMNTPEVVAQIRAGREQQAAIAQMTAAAPGAAAVIKAVNAGERPSG